MTVANRLKFTVAITSAATITPPASPNIAGYRVLAGTTGAIASGDLTANATGVPLVIEDANGWEESYFTVSADGLSFTRTSVVANSLGTTAAMTFSGTVTVYCTPFADYVNKLLISTNGVTLAGLTAASSVSGSTVFECSNDGGTTSLLTTLTQIAAAVASINGTSSSGASSIATAITLSGPTSGTVSVASSNFTVGVSPVGSAISGTITVTPSDNGGGGSFSPTSVALTSAAPTATFRYTPSATAGARTISVTNSAALTAPASITYTSSAAAGAAATAIAVSGPTSGTVSVASTNFTASANGAITGTVVVTPSDGGAGGAFTPTTVSISSGTPTATFTYTPNAPAGAKTLSFTNNGGLTNPANITYTASAAATSNTHTVQFVTSGNAVTTAAAAIATNITRASTNSGSSGGFIAFSGTIGIGTNYVNVNPSPSSYNAMGWSPSSTVPPATVSSDPSSGWADANGYATGPNAQAGGPGGAGTDYSIGGFMGIPDQPGTYYRYLWVKIDNDTWVCLNPNNPCIITLS